MVFLYHFHPKVLQFDRQRHDRVAALSLKFTGGNAVVYFDHPPGVTWYFHNGEIIVDVELILNINYLTGLRYFIHC